MAEAYGARVILHTDHCAKKLLGWVDGLLDVGEEYYAATGKPLFSSHMLDLSEEPLEENVEISKRYLERMSAIDMTLEIELGITGGEEDGVDNSDADDSRPVHQARGGGVRLRRADEGQRPLHGRGRVRQRARRVQARQRQAQADDPARQPGVHRRPSSAPASKPVDFVFHGGSGSSPDEIAEAICYGVVKMNIDTDLQWAFWDGIRGYEAEKHDYLQSQIGNPDGPDKPNKKHYDPRVWLRAGEVSFVERVKQAFAELNNVGTLA